MRLRSMVRAVGIATGAVLIAQVGGLTSVSAAPDVSRARSAPVKAVTVETPGDYDARTGGTPAAKRALRARSARLEAAPAVQSFARSLGRQSIVDLDPMTGTPSSVMRLDGLLTGPSASSARSVALGYVAAHPAVFKLDAADLRGLSLARDYVDIDGIHHLSFTQRAGGLPIFGNGLKANVTKDGRLVSLSGSPAAHPAGPAPAVHSLTPDDAIAAAKRDVHESTTTRRTGDSARAVAFLTLGGTRRAYETVTMSAKDPTLDVIDASSGRVLYRDHLSDDFAGSSYDEPASDPAPGTRPQRQFALAYPNYPGAALGGQQVPVDLTTPGWLPRGARQLKGNNVTTYTDVDDDNKADRDELVGPQADRNYLYELTPFYRTSSLCASHVCDWNPNRAYSWQTNRAQTATNNFVVVNQFHDYLAKAPIGFTEAAGNFQQVNSSEQGAGGDPVLDEPMDGADTASGLPDSNHIDNANFATPPDGVSPRMQMFLWHTPHSTDPFLPSSGADEADIVLHEYSHGLSHRLVVDAGGTPALDSTQGASMGEAWSDYYALDYLANKRLLTDQAGVADVEIGRYVLPDQDFRFEPTDCRLDSPISQCPGGADTGPGGFTYGDFGKVLGRPEVHADGEIWAQTLWDLRTTLGSRVTDRVVTRGMELSPTFPSYLDMRNAIIVADQAVYGGAHVSQLWSLFAARGMGFYASTITGDDITPTENFSTPPPADTTTGSLTGTATDSATGEPIGGVTVAFGGHDSGLPGADWAATSDSNGRYRIDGVPTGTYSDVFAVGAGYDQAVTTVDVVGAGATRDFTLVRNWAASSGGATIAATNGDEFADVSCGAAADIDQSYGVGWSAFLPTTPDGKYLTIALPEPIDLSSIQIDPANTCGDAGSASTGDFRLETSKDGTTFTPAASGTFQVEDRHRLNIVPLAPGTSDDVRFIRFTALTSQVALIGGSCPGPYAGCTFVDSTEIEAFGAPAD